MNDEESVTSTELVDVAIAIETLDVLAIKIVEPFDVLITVSGDGVVEGGIALVGCDDFEYGNNRSTEVVSFVLCLW